jgi:uncharacterized protein YhaN
MEANQAPPQAAQPDLQQQLAEAQAAMAQMQQQLQAAEANTNALYQHVQQVAHQLAATQAVQAAAAQAAAAPPQQRNQIAEALLRIPAQQFDGKRGSSKHLSDWIADLDRRFSVMQPAPTDTQKVTYAAALLVQKAKAWYNKQAHLLLTWPDFTAALERRYQPLNQQEHAVDRLQNLKQSGSVSAYCGTFNDLVMEVPGIPDRVLCRMFVNGLKQRIRAMVKTQSNGMNLEDVQTLADQLEEVELEERELNKGIHANNSVRPPLPRNQPQYNPNMRQREGPAPMELGARQLHRQHRLAPTNRRFVRVTDNTRRVLSTAPTCTHCRRTGHTFDRCPARGARPPARPYQGNGQRRRQ